MRLSYKIIFLTCLSAINIFNHIKCGSLLGRAGVLYTTTQNNFRDQQGAYGLVRMANGFTVAQPASGAGSTHGASVYMDTCISVSGAIDLRSTNTIILLADLTLDNGVTFSSGGRFYGYDRAVYLNGDLTIPAGNVIHIGGRVVIDGLGHKLILGGSAQLFVDANSTLTLKDLVLQGIQNQPGHPFVQCATPGSKLCLEDSEIIPGGDFWFNQGQLFIHDDVAFSGTCALVYRTIKPLMITSGAKLFFDIGTTFSVAPATFTDCPYSVKSTYTTNNFIWMADQTSQLYLNGCSFFTTLTGCRLRTGSLFFDNKVTMNSNAASAINATVPMVSLGSVGTGSAPESVSWSPDGRFLAVVNYSGNTLQIFSFSGSGNPILIGSVGTGGGSTPASVSWSPDGRFLAVANNSGNTLQIFSFNGSGNPTLIGSIGTASEPTSVSWSPDGRFLAVVNINGNIRCKYLVLADQVIRF